MELLKLDKLDLEEGDLKLRFYLVWTGFIL
jgi:hypothetical protein